MIKPIQSWLDDHFPTEFVEQSGRTVKDQLQQLDSAGTGIGFVFVLTRVLKDVVFTGDQPVPAVAYESEQELQLTNHAVFKIRNAWYVAIDDNISDIACAIIRMVVENIPK